MGKDAGPRGPQSGPEAPPSGQCQLVPAYAVEGTGLDVYAAHARIPAHLEGCHPRETLLLLPPQSYNRESFSSGET